MNDVSGQLLISVIIPTKNRRSLVSETLESVRNQTYLHWEAVVIDDLSDDDTWSVLQDLARRDTRIRPVLRTGPIGGPAEARNQGFATSHGSFILFLDSDDLLVATALENRLKAFSKFPEADAIVGDSEYFRYSPGEYHEECVQSNRLFDGVDTLDAFLTAQSLWCTSGPLWRRTAVEKVGPWKTNHDNQYHTYALVIGLQFVRIGVIDWFIRLHTGHKVSLSNISDLPLQRDLLVDAIQMLRIHQMLTRRRKRMLAWRCLLDSLTCAVERARPSFRETLGLWSNARQVKLIGYGTFVSGMFLIGLQRSKVLGRIPRECARLILYFDLKRQPPFTKGFLASITQYSEYISAHFRNWKSAQSTVANG